MIRLIAFILLMIACMVFIWFTHLGLGWKIVVDVWCAFIIWIAIEMKLSPIMDADETNEPTAKVIDDIEWGDIWP